jgi:hypothetical protein
MKLRKQKSVLFCHAITPVIAITLLFLCVVYCHAAGEELPAGSGSGSAEPADTAPVVIVTPQDETKPQAGKDSMLTEDEAYDLVWNLPEVKKEIEKILDQGGVPYATIAARPDQGGKPEENNSLYTVRFQAVRGKNIAVELLFYVDATNGQVLVSDSFSGKLIPIDEWRRHK